MLGALCGTVLGTVLRFEGMEPGCISNHTNTRTMTRTMASRSPLLPLALSASGCIDPCMDRLMHESFRALCSARRVHCWTHSSYYCPVLPAHLEPMTRVT